MIQTNSLINLKQKQKLSTIESALLLIATYTDQHQLQFNFDNQYKPTVSVNLHKNGYCFQYDDAWNVFNSITDNN